MDEKKKHPGGRPGKYETEIKPRFDEIIGWLSIGAAEKEIAQLLGINPSTLIEYKKKHPEFSELLQKNRRKPVEDIKAALYKRATGFMFQEKKTVIEYEEFSDDLVKALEGIGLDPSAFGQRRMVRTEIYDKYQPPDPASAMILLKHWDQEHEWTNDPATLKIRKEELAFKKQQAEKEDW